MLNMAIKNISNGRGISLCIDNILPLKNMVVWPQQSLILRNKLMTLTNFELGSKNWCKIQSLINDFVA